MKLTKPSYFDNFRCIAGKCPDSCCQEWAVQVDSASAAFYRSLPGALGDRLRQVLTEENGDTVMQIENRRCPMWREDGLCRIQAELGEAALCETCHEFPRLRHDYGSFLELGLELSCPEAARLILSDGDCSPVTLDIPGGTEADYDTEAMEILLSTRETARALLADPTRDVPITLALLLMFGLEAQARLDGDETLPFDPEAALADAREFAVAADSREIPEFFGSLEILTEDWPQYLTDPAPAEWEEDHRKLARYFVDRYWLQAVSDYDLYCRIKFVIISCLVIRQVGGNLLRTAQLYSKEIENNIDNVETLLDAAYSHPAFTDRKLLGYLLGPEG